MNRESQIFRFFSIQRVGLTVAYVAERAASGADLTHNHKGRCAVAKTFMQVWTGGLFTDRSHLMFAQNILNGLNLG